MKNGARPGPSLQIHGAYGRGAMGGTLRHRDRRACLEGSLRAPEFQRLSDLDACFRLILCGFWTVSVAFGASYSDGRSHGRGRGLPERRRRGDGGSSGDVHPLIASSVFHYEFEFIHPSPGSSDCMGRLWQSLILARWNPLFADIPVESLIFEHQAEYYQALRESTHQADSAPFIAFMMRMILDAILLPAPEVTPEVTPEVRLLMALSGEMTRRQLKEALGLKDDEHFRKSYLLPALHAGLIEMTIQDKPRSSKQKYRLTGMGRKRLSRNSEE